MAALGNGGRRRFRATKSGLGQRSVEPREAYLKLFIEPTIGLSTWDTANVYSSGRNEEIIGKAIKKFNIPREKLTILAKCCGTVPEEPGIFNWPFEPQMQKSKDYVNKGGKELFVDRECRLEDANNVL